ncbi:MAG: DUF3109 family protein [Bacteroidia bacterium]|nr:DUF3109 family protein [Bacteroidia bacterium]
MLAVGETLVAEALLDTFFVCDLNACSGACCIEGESGAPLEAEETETLEKIWPLVRPFIPPDGIKAIEGRGTWLVDSDGDYVTPLVKGKHCAYTVFRENGTAACGIEDAWKAGKISFKKPVSCHLYPVRLKEGSPFLRVEYHRWKICKAACLNGEKLQLPLFRFLKDALIRRFGKKWYAELELVHRERSRIRKKT